jgi:hypothetical protein
MLVSVEMRFVRSTARYSVPDPKRNGEIMRGPQILEIAQFIEYRTDWEAHVDSVGTNRVPEKIVNRKEKKFWRACEPVEGLCLVISMMCVDVPNTRLCDNDDTYDDDQS